MKFNSKLFRSQGKELIFSFVLAFILWFMVVANKVYEDRFEIPIKIVSLPEGKILSNRLPDHITAELRGRGRSLFSLYVLKPSLQLELSTFDKSASIDLNVYKNNISLPKDLGVEITRIIHPLVLDIHLDQYIEQKIPVRLDYTVNTAAGYLLDGTTIEPESVLVKGPELVVSNLTEILTEPVFRQDEKFPFETAVKIINAMPGILRMQPSQVHAKFLIERYVERNIYNIPIQILGVPAHLVAEARPATITIKVKGAESTVSYLKTEDVAVSFNYRTQYRSAHDRYPYEIELPDNISLVSKSPNIFTITLRERASE